MDCDATVTRVEPAAAPRGARMLPVEQLRVADAVLDRSGRPHPIAAISAGGDHAVWVQRSDLAYRELLRGAVMAVPRRR
ncbi:hypothetical protein [Angustibacter aerolatus]